MGLIKCVVPGCEDRSSPRRRFPIYDQELYEEWLNRIGSKELTDLDPKFVGTNKRICSIHFSSHCRVPNSTKLKNRSLPTLHLSGFKEAPSEENSILKYPRRTVTIARAELLRYIKDFKPDPEDLDGNESKPSKPPADPLAISEQDVSEIQKPVVDEPLVKTSVCNRLLTEAIESLDKEITQPVFVVSSGASLTKEADCDCKDNLKPLFTASADLTHNKPCPQLDVLPPSKTEPVTKDERPLSPALDYISPGDSDTETSIIEPMNIDFTYLMLFSSLPDSPLIKDESPLKVPAVKCSQVKKSVTCPVQPEVAAEPQDDEDDDGDGDGDDDAANIEPMNIDFTYLMKITALPDTPLIKDESAPSKTLAPQPPTLHLTDSAVDSLSYPSLINSPAPEDTSNYHNPISSAFDLEEFINEEFNSQFINCKSPLTEIPSTSYHWVFANLENSKTGNSTGISYRDGNFPLPTYF